MFLAKDKVLHLDPCFIVYEHEEREDDVSMTYHSSVAVSVS